MVDQISKKELLRMCGISYGQLYRWKREKLIPEEWFHKQSSPTGQETFFPKEAILRRIQKILELKDLYSLEEMAEMFSPEFVDRLFHEDDLDQFKEIEMDIAAKCMDVMEKDVFNFREILLMCVLSQALNSLSLKEGLQDALIEEVMTHCDRIPTLDHTLAILQIEETVVSCVYATSAKPLLDTRIHVVFEMDLQEYSNQMKVKYQDVFHFQID